MSGRILITGASGFVGSALVALSLAQSRAVCGAVRSAIPMMSSNGLEMAAVGDIDAQTDWSEALTRVNCVIHCAARAHVMRDAEGDALAAYRSVNLAGTRRLAEQAAASGVRRLVFLSSVKVNGEQTAHGAPFSFSDAPAPQDSYGVSKWEAEQALWTVSAQTGLEVVVVRLPLVYGPGVRGNLLRLLRLVAGGLPLPLGALHNRRSMVGLSNLVDLLLRCAEHPAAAGRTFLASDGHDLSTPELIRLIAEGVNRPARLLPVPEALLQAGGSLLGKRSEIERLVGSLQVDSGYTRAKLGWTPPVAVEDGVREMAKWYARLLGA